MRLGQDGEGDGPTERRGAPLAVHRTEFEWRAGASKPVRIAL